MNRPSLINNEIYHIYNRGVEKRQVFLDDKDYLRFIHDMFEFNNQAPALNLNYYFQSGLTGGDSLRKSRKLLVEILCFCIMPNHYHFLLRQKVNSGITEFMRKIGTGYTNYFNQKNKRVGPLFQGKFKAVHLKEERHLLYLPHYIHSNPLDLIMPEWRERGISNLKKAIKFLESYRWSSYLDFINKKNFPSVGHYRSPTSINFGNYEREIHEWLEDFNLGPIENIILE